LNQQEHAIKAEALVHRYSKSAEPALNGCSLTVRRGEFYGLLGPNGAGKTTIIALLSGLFMPQGGRIHILGLDLRRQAGVEKVSH